MANLFEFFEECIENITKNNLSKKSIMDHYQQIVLLIDEMVDEGIIINTDGENLENKINMKDTKIVNEGGYFRGVIMLY